MNAQDEPRELPASSGEFRLMWHRKVKSDSDRSRSRTGYGPWRVTGDHQNGSRRDEQDGDNVCRMRMIGYSILETT